MENPDPSWRPLKRLVAAIFIVAMPVFCVFLMVVCDFSLRYLVENDPFIVNEVKISYSGQINGKFEAQGDIVCIDRNKVPFLSFPASEEDNHDRVTVYLNPGIKTGNYQFTNGNIEGNGILFRAFLYPEAGNGLILDFEDLSSTHFVKTSV